MPYDASLDECVFTKAHEDEAGKLVVSVYSYNKGTRKLQITRENRVSGELRFTKLGRMTKQEVEAILPLIQEAMKFLD